MIVYYNSIKSIANLISTFSSGMMETIIGRFPVDFFRHRYIDTASLSYQRRSPKKIILYRTPAISFKPNLSVEENLFNSNDIRNIIERKIKINEEDGTNLILNFERMRINFEIKIKLETRLLGYDILNYMKNLFPFNSFLHKETFFEIPLPNDMVEIFMMLKGYSLNKIEDVRNFVSYLNYRIDNSNFNFSYKKNLLTGKYAIFISYLQNAQIFFEGFPQIDFNTKNKISDYSFLSFECYIESWVPQLFRLDFEELVFKSFNILKIDKKFINIDEEENITEVDFNHYIELYRFIMDRINNKAYLISRNLNKEFKRYMNYLLNILYKFNSNISSVINDYDEPIIDDILNKYPEKIRNFISEISYAEKNNFLFEKSFSSIKPINGLYEGQENTIKDMNDPQKDNLDIFRKLNKEELKSYKTYFDENIGNILNPLNPLNPNYDINENINSLNSKYNKKNPESFLNKENINYIGNSMKDLEGIFTNIYVDNNTFEDDKLESKIDSTINNTILLNFYIQNKPPEIYNNKTLFKREFFVTDINNQIEEINISENLDVEEKKVIEYILTNRLKIDDYFILYIKEKGDFYNEKNRDVSFKVNWETFYIKFLNPKYNVTYELIIYRDVVLYNEILKKLNPI